MVSGKFKSIGEVMYRVLRNPLAAELTFTEAAEFALEYIRLLGAPLTYIDKVKSVELNSYKGELPCDLLYIKAVKYSACHFRNHEEGVAMRYASNSFHTKLDNQDNYNDNDSTEYTYIIQHGVIITSIAEGSVQISYKAVATDEHGYPLIPDNEKVVMGLEYYILYRYLEPLWMMGKVTDKAWSHVDQKKCWYIGAADASLRNITPDQMETLVNGINRLIRNTHSQDSFFKQYGSKEQIKKYRG